MDNPLRQHPALGVLRWDEELKWWETSVDIGPFVGTAFCLFAEREYQVFAAPDEIFAAGVDYLAWARSAELQCRRHIADHLLATFNDVWANDGTEEDDDAPGRMEREQFVNHLQLSAIHLHTDGRGAWYYDDQDLFAGHSIEVFVTEDRQFSRAHLAG